MSGSSLRIENLTKMYDEGSTIVAVEDLSVDVGAGEFLVFVGPSGCGKSTTLRCIGGLEHPTSGEIYLGGQPIADEPPQARDIAMVFQDYALYPHMTARENMSFGLRMSTDLSKEEIRETVDRVAEMMDITAILDKRPGELSGGQQQRVALGRAIVRDPDVFLMDEPLSNLDAKLRAKMRTELQELQRELGVTTIYVTHNQTEAMTMGDRIVVLNDGRLQQVGTPTECYHDPANLFVASFIGSPSMNFLYGTLDREEATFVSDAFEYEFPAELREEVSALGTESVVFGVRPEALEVTEDPAAADMTLRATVIEPRGDVTYVNGELGEDTLTVTIPIRHRREGGRLIREGEEFDVVVPTDSLYLFDRKSGESLLSTVDAGTVDVTPPT